MKSDTDCEVSSESEPQAGKAPQRRKSPQKKRAAQPPGSDVVVEDQYSDGDDLPARVEGLSLGATGTDREVGGWGVVDYVLNRPPFWISDTKGCSPLADVFLVVVQCPL